MTVKKPALTFVAAIIIVASLAGVGYASYYAVTISSDNSAISEYGVATITFEDNEYWLSYSDTSADTAYLTVEISDISGNGDIAELWLGSAPLSVSNNSFGLYHADCSGSTLVSLKKVLAGTSSVTDGNVSFGLSYSDGILTVTGADYTSGLNFYHGTNIYVVVIDDDSISQVYRIIPVEEAGSKYVFCDDGVSYLLTVSEGVVSGLHCSDVLYSMVVNQKASFGTHTITGFATPGWRLGIKVICEGTVLDLSEHEIMVKVFSPGESS